MSRQDNLGITITLQNNEIKSIIDLFSILTEKESTSIEVDFDYSIITMKKKSKNKEIYLNVKVGKETKIIRDKDGNVSWEIEEDDIEYANFYFREGEKNGYLSPAELFQVKVAKNKHLDYIYCKLKSAAG